MRTILISGASRGIGRSIAERALKDGHRISLGVREPATLKGTILDPNISGRERVLLSNYDANEEGTIKGWIENTLNTYKTFDSIIYSAGVFHSTNLLYKDNERKDIEELFNVNIMGPWKLIRDCWQTLVKNNDSRIIVIVSMSGKRSKSNLAGYSMSKFGLMGLCQTIRNEGWEKGLRVTAICPGWVNTEMSSAIKTLPKEAMTQPKDIASIISNLLNLPNSCIPHEIAVNCVLEK